MKFTALSLFFATIVSSASAQATYSLYQNTADCNPSAPGANVTTYSDLVFHSCVGANEGTFSISLDYVQPGYYCWLYAYAAGSSSCLYTEQIGSVQPGGPTCLGSTTPIGRLVILVFDTTYEHP
ncbi:hypothetical protein AX16_009158 [Volvariella volvacea WC 439]|nr:hypothetical protein AX16_009158 [Volvariella volvacea WC 439]